MQIIRCKVCKRLFSDLSDCCPDCHRRSPRGWMQLLLIVGSIIVAAIAIAVTLVVAGRN